MIFGKNEKLKDCDFTTEKLAFLRYLLRYFTSNNRRRCFHLSHLIIFLKSKNFPSTFIMTLDIYYRYIITFCSYNGNSIDHMPCRIYNFGWIFFTFYASGDLLGNATHNETNDFEFLLVHTQINTFSNTINHHMMAGELVFDVYKIISMTCKKHL